MTFDPMSVEVTCVTLCPRIIVSKSHVAWALEGKKSPNPEVIELNWPLNDFGTNM